MDPALISLYVDVRDANSFDLISLVSTTQYVYTINANYTWKPVKQ